MVSFGICVILVLHTVDAAFFNALSALFSLPSLPKQEPSNVFSWLPFNLSITSGREFVERSEEPSRERVYEPSIRERISLSQPWFGPKPTFPPNPNNARASWRKPSTQPSVIRYPAIKPNISRSLQDRVPVNNSVTSNNDSWEPNWGSLVYNSSENIIDESTEDWGSGYPAVEITENENEGW